MTIYNEEPPEEAMVSWLLWWAFLIWLWAERPWRKVK